MISTSFQFGLSSTPFCAPVVAVDAGTGTGSCGLGSTMFVEPTVVAQQQQQQLAQHLHFQPQQTPMLIAPQLFSSFVDQMLFMSAAATVNSNNNNGVVVAQPVGTNLAAIDAIGGNNCAGQTLFCPTPTGAIAGNDVELPPQPQTQHQLFSNPLAFPITTHTITQLPANWPLTIGIAAQTPH